MMTTYEGLLELYRKKDGKEAFTLALSTLLDAGAAELLLKSESPVCRGARSRVTSDELRNLPEGMKTKVKEFIVALAFAPADVIGAFVQRQVSPYEDPDGKKIPHLHPNDDEDDVCPVCGHEGLDYNGDRELDDVGTTVTWVCPDCGATGTSVYNDSFDSHRNVCDMNGIKIEGREDC